MIQLCIDTLFRWCRCIVGSFTLQLQRWCRLEIFFYNFCRDSQYGTICITLHTLFLHVLYWYLKIFLIPYLNISSPYDSTKTLFLDKSYRRPYVVRLWSGLGKIMQVKCSITFSTFYYCCVIREVTTRALPPHRRQRTHSKTTWEFHKTVPASERNCNDGN